MELKQRIQLTLTLLGGKTLNEIVRVTMRGMAKEIRMKYVVQKVTKGKHVFKVHKNLFGFVLGNISSQLLYIVGKKYEFCFSFPFTDVVRLYLAQEKLLDATEKEIFHQIGLLLTSSGDEDRATEVMKSRDLK